MRLTFHGGVKAVTGANYLLEAGGKSFLIDCGMHQGGHYCELENWNPFPYDPKSIDAVFITHSHIDHIGRLPYLVRSGFEGKIYSTAPTRDASGLLLKDSQHILAQSAERFNKPELYSEFDVEKTMEIWEVIDYYQPLKINGVEIVLHNAGHILGSSFITFNDSQKKITFSGDLGNSPAPLLGDKDSLPETDYCLIESTYGGRIHEAAEQRREILEDIIEDTVKAGGVLMIPAFAMERTQELLFEINQLAEQGRIPRAPIFLDSPLAIQLTNVFNKYKNFLKNEHIMTFNLPGLKKTLTTDESKAIARVASPKIIIAGAGMSNAGRILHHEHNYLSDPNSTLLIIGYQAEGTLGRKILDGAKEVKIFGDKIPVRCRVRAIGGYSAHADQPQLLAWLKSQRQVLKNVFVVQGEEDQSSALEQKIKDELAVRAEIPEANKTYEL